MGLPYRSTLRRWLSELPHGRTLPDERWEGRHRGMILLLWAQARARFAGSGNFLFGDWCAADIMYAPVVTRFITYGVAVPPFAELYMKAALSHPHVHEWVDLAQDEPWVIEQYEDAAA